MKILLGSKSPRRQELLKACNIDFTLIDIICDETFPDTMRVVEIAEHLAIKKSKAYKGSLQDSLLLTADTTVILGNKVLNKPKNEQHAIDMLLELSGNVHQVLTGVCLRTDKSMVSFTESTDVHFKKLYLKNIEYYVRNYKPFDKAGAYGIQEWIGLTGITKIVGDYYNVVGLPVQKIVEQLRSTF
ncbi:MAG: septum formation protein Maf [Flavobacteriales bacterium]|nr:septum formation protein Maf [Flavobacteriales bacterium]